MRYSIYVSYPGGSKSHKLKTTSRASVEARLAHILGEHEVLELAQCIVIHHGRREILNIPASTPATKVIESVQWPVCGAPVKVVKPVSTSLYMPQAVRDWLKANGNGKASVGLRKLVELADIPDLRDAWRN